MRAEEAAQSQAFMRRTFTFMGAGLAITGLVATFVASRPDLVGALLPSRGLFIGLLIAELLVVLAFTALVNRVSAPVAGAMLVAYAALSGVTFSVFFLIYTAGSLGSTFMVTAGTFGATALYGAVTKRNLDSVGSFCMMGLFGVIIGSVVNIFLGSSALTWLTTFMSIIVFTGLAAYDTQKLRTMVALSAPGTDQTKLALQGALSLYLDFVNLFLALLRIFGKRRN